MTTIAPIERESAGRSGGDVGSIRLPADRPAVGRFGMPADRALRLILVAGVLLRLVVFVGLRPQGNDDHYAVIQYILDHLALPTADVTSQAYHPPLYYLMAAPFAALGRLKGTQFLSLLLAVANLWLIVRALATTTLLGGPRVRRFLAAIAAFLPQFVIFSLFISNDTLSFLVGTLTFLAAFAYVERPTRSTLVALALAAGLGLATKGTFIGIAPVAAWLVIVVGWRQRLPLSRQLVAFALFAVVTGVVGGYKFVENQRHFGRPVVHNMDFETPTLIRQRGTIRGVSSFVDVNLPRLLAHPFETTNTLHSVPLLMYATTWYPYIRESNLGVTRRGWWALSMSALCLAGLVPTLLLVVGLVAFGRGAVAGRRLRALDDTRFATLARRAFVVAFLAADVAVVLAAGFRYDAWSCFQGRLVFPALFGALLAAGWGYEAIAARSDRARRVVEVALVAGCVAFLAYFAIEIPGAAMTRLGIASASSAGSSLASIGLALDSGAGAR